MIQRALRSVGSHIKDDGKIGPLTLEGINASLDMMLLAAIRSEAAGFYRALILRNAALRKRGHDVKDFSIFKNGWLRRAYE